MPLHVPTLLTRTGSAVVFGAVMLGGLLWTDWAFAVLVGIIAVLCLWEYFQLTDRILREETTPIIRIGLPVLATAWLGALAIDRFAPIQRFHAAGAWGSTTVNWSLTSTLLFVPVLVLLSALAKRGSLLTSLAAVSGLGYIILPCALLISIRALNPLWPLVLILCIWINDTMAYIVGSLIGHTPFSSISPKKTWEGTAGGAILTVLAAALWAYYSEAFPIRDVVAVALCAAIAGTAGDLFESKLKRLAGVKDSGRIMPGHGGALDRFDSLLVATPFAFAYLYLTQI